jgi:hypothetical protein
LLVKGWYWCDNVIPILGVVLRLWANAGKTMIILAA